MDIATWNINSVNARLELLLEYLDKEKPDVMALQEIKCQEESFPFAKLQEAGYHAIASGQKSYNGVALLAKKEPLNVLKELPNCPTFPTPQARFISADVKDEKDTIQFISIYVPNGNPTPTSQGDERLQYKLNWFDALKEYLSELNNRQIPFVLAGDFNVIIEDEDVYNPEVFRTDALMLPEVRAKLEEIVNDLRLTNTLKSLHPQATEKENRLYTFWDYTRNAWGKNAGILLDDIFLSENIAKRLATAEIDKYMRGKEKPSDHVPLRIQIL